MKLVEILARELKEWPKGAEKLSQTFAGMIFYLDPDGQIVTLARYSIAEDWVKSEVTRAEWKAELARMYSDMYSNPAKNSNKDGWIRHRGGKCPVDAGAVVDVRYRGGHIDSNINMEQFRWNHDGGSVDIMAYRLHKPADQRVIELPEGYGEVITATLESIDGPFEWRDRITEIDASVEALEEERASLVQRLEAEGFRLIERAVQPVEDMSNPKNWKNGDLITFVLDRKDRCFTTGKQYIFIGRDKYGAAGVAKDDQGDRNGWCFEYFKFHSRPCT